MSEFKFFKLEDFDCQETGENEMDVEFIKGLDHLRQTCGFPFVITSGFRSLEHSATYGRGKTRIGFRDERRRCKDVCSR